MATGALDPVDLSFSSAELEDQREQITAFIAEAVDEAGAEGCILGLSGGVDSSTVAHLAVEALGPDAIYGVVLPGVVSRDENMSDAEAVAEKLDIEYDVIEIDPLVEAIQAAVPIEGDERAVGNLRARTRAVINYFIANAESRVVLGTGNRSEAITGYFTKYGDGAVDVNPIGNLYKCQVRQLAREIGVPERIITKPPSAGLWAGQTDEDELGISYETLDPILALHIDGPLSRAATANTLDIDLETIDSVTNLVEKSEHKRQQPPTP